MEAKEAEEGESRHVTQPGGRMSVEGRKEGRSFQKKMTSAEGEKELVM